MTQPLSIRIANQPHTRRCRSHVGTILLLRKDIQRALNDGWSRHAVWQTLFAEERITIGYHAFLRYLRRVGIRGPQLPAPPAQSAPTPASGTDVA